MADVIRLASGYRMPAPTDRLDENGRCRLSELLPAECALPCHRNSEDIGVVDDLPDAA